MFSKIFYQPIEIISLVLHFISSWRSLILWSLITENELIWNATLCRHRFLRQFFLSFFTKCTFHSSFKVIYPKYYKNSWTFVNVGRLGRLGITDNFCIFAKKLYVLILMVQGFFSYFPVKMDTKLKFLYIIVSTLKSWST